MVYTIPYFQSPHFGEIPYNSEAGTRMHYDDSLTSALFNLENIFDIENRFDLI